MPRPLDVATGGSMNKVVRQEVRSRVSETERALVAFVPKPINGSGTTEGRRPQADGDAYS